MGGDKKRHGAPNGRITCHVINAGRIGNLLAILNHPSDMKAQGFCRSAPRFFQSSTSGNAPRKIWEAHAKIRFPILVQICDVIHQSSQSYASLLFDASQRANWYISNRMWHRDLSRPHRMLELLVAPNMGNLIPAVLFQALYDLSPSSLSSAAFFEFLSAPTRTVVIPSHLRGFPNWGVPAKLDLAVFVLFKARPPTHLFFRIVDQSIPLL